MEIEWRDLCVRGRVVPRCACGGEAHGKKADVARDFYLVWRRKSGALPLDWVALQVTATRIDPADG